MILEQNALPTKPNIQNKVVPTVCWAGADPNLAADSGAFGVGFTQVLQWICGENSTLNLEISSGFQIW